VHRFNRRIYNICYRFSGSGEHADDLTQEVFIKMYKTLSTYDVERGAFMPGYDHHPQPAGGPLPQEQAGPRHGLDRRWDLFARRRQPDPADQLEDGAPAPTKCEEAAVADWSTGAAKNSLQNFGSIDSKDYNT